MKEDPSAEDGAAMANARGLLLYGPRQCSKTYEHICTYIHIAGPCRFTSTCMFFILVPRMV
jgi:hypothetical protein